MFLGFGKKSEMPHEPVVTGYHTLDIKNLINIIFNCLISILFLKPYYFVRRSQLLKNYLKDKLMNDFVILSKKQPQYLFLSKILKKTKFNNYYFIQEKKKDKLNSFFRNFKKLLKSKKKIKFIIYYFLQILLFKKYSRKYSFLKKKFFNHYEKKIKDKDKEIQKFRIKKNFKNKSLILFGAPYVNSKFIKNFKFVYNIHMGILLNTLD